ncbi:hypothetical protein ABZ464_21665 [Streptomyces sp. NPDC005820]|uniref:hypothetical protein n=1 Tax=Streptomyces sp. NPDC005820 TaxID=3157069 RepID=UPI00340A9992
MNGQDEAGRPAPAFAGDFESHLTIRPGARGAPDDALPRWARRHGMKYTRIVLDRGASPDQPMLTGRGRGTLAAQRTAAREWTDLLRRDGFDVTRLKIEASPWNADVPLTRVQAAALPGEHCYFEHHVKLVLTDAPARLRAVRELAERHAAHLSRNARRALDADHHERFVTQRCRGVGRFEARRRLDALTAALTDAGHRIVETEEEFVVYDDNPALDAGWIHEPAPAASLGGPR